MARRNSAHGMHKTVRLLATGLAALILCGGMVLLFVQKERAAANAAGEPTAEPIAPTPAPRFTVVIDPGHGLPDGGATGMDTGIAEEGINLNYATALRDELSALNIAAVLTREDENALNADKKKDMAARRDIINSAGAAAVISIHMNKFSDTSVHGAETFYYEPSVESRQLAECIQISLKNELDSTNTRTIKGVTNLFVLKTSKAPSVLIECGYISNPTEEAKLNTPSYQRRIAFSVCCGILSYYNNQNPVQSTAG